MLQKESFKVVGLDCQEEVGLLQKVLLEKSGIFNLHFEVLKAKMTVEYENETISAEQIIKSVEVETGMHVTLWKERHLIEPKGMIKKHGRLLMTILSGISIGVGGALEYSGRLDLARCLYLVSIMTAGSFIAVKAFFSLRKLRADMHVLMVIAVIGALIIDQWMEAAAVTFLFSLSVFLEHMTLNKARKEITALMKLSPSYANVLEQGSYEKKDVYKVKVGDLILVKPGENVPVDAVIIQGGSFFDQSPITGESLPVFKTVGDTVFAGTFNQESSIECRVTAKSQDTVLAKMMRLIEESQGKRSSSEKWIEIFASIYTPCVIALAMVVGLIVPIFLGHWFMWIYRGLVVLVIACPCALIISTPVTIIAGLTAAAKFGILIKGGIFLELPRKLQAIAFDKTGTLTFGRPSIQKIISLANYDEKGLLNIAAALESASTHPLAIAILDRAKKEGVLIQHAQDVKILPGKGVEGLIKGEKFWVGSHRLMHEKKLETPNMHAIALQLEDAGHSVVAVGDEKQIYGLLSIADTPRIHLQDVMEQLKKAGIKKTIMLTGDNTACAAAIAQVSGVDEFFSEMLPQNKVEAIEELKAKYHYVAMVGDGVNDASAMVVASVGIAMGTVGTDTAIETADITLMTDDLTKLPWLIRHSKKVMQLIWQNVIFALLVKAVFLFFAILGEASLWMAIASDTGASFIVIFNGLRLLKR
ncbi:MAG: cation-translocating P-type ATPase [Chlamydiota bacterium]